jgi:hypothetical protein
MWFLPPGTLKEYKKDAAYAGYLSICDITSQINSIFSRN